MPMFSFVPRARRDSTSAEPHTLDSYLTVQSIESRPVPGSIPSRREGMAMNRKHEQERHLSMGHFQPRTVMQMVDVLNDVCRSLQERTGLPVTEEMKDTL